MFVVFEGIDGSGKGTQIKHASTHLKTLAGEDNVVQTKDPGGTPLGGAIREILYDKVPTTQLATGVVDLLFLASHLQNWLTVVEPALAAGKSVITDRWWYSQCAYMTQRIVPEPIAAAYRRSHGANADLLIFLWGDPEILIERARSREDETHQSKKSWNDVEKLRRIQDTYFHMFASLPEWCPICVDEKTPDQIAAEVAAALTGAYEDLCFKKI